METKQISIRVPADLADALEAAGGGNRSAAFTEAAKLYLIAKETAELRAAGHAEPSSEWTDMVLDEWGVE